MIDNGTSESRDEQCNPTRSVKACEFDRDLIKVIERAQLGRDDKRLTDCMNVVVCA